MNERIRELINEAFIGTTDGKLSELNTVKNIEKFAELLIRECAFVAHNKDAHKDWLKYGRGLAAGKILEHFGY